MGIFSPRNTSVLAVLLIVFYIIVLGNAGTVPPVANFIFMMTIGGLIGVSAFNFAATEVKETEGLLFALDLSLGKLVSIFLFSFFIAIGYNALTLVIVEIIYVNSTNTIFITQALMTIVVGFLTLFPFFQFLFLGKPGEDSSIPAEFPIENAMEKLAYVVRSPLIAAIIAYSVLYVAPISILTVLLGINLLTAILLWALVLPLISLGALAGAGLGEDLIRLRLVRRFSDLPKLGLPKINLRELRFDVGGLILVIFAIQAILFAGIYTIQGLQVWLGLRNQDQNFLISVIGVIGYLGITLLNKGRGAFKELKEVWTESGFKVSVFQLFLPVFVFLGVILSSSLEVFIQQVSTTESSNLGVLAQLGLINHIRLSSFFLVVQNIILIVTAVIVFRRTPGAAERRLIKEVPEFYGDDLEGYEYIYNKLTDSKSIENLIVELTKKISDDTEQIEFLKALLEKSIDIDDDDVKTAIGEAIHLISRKEVKFHQNTYMIVKSLIESNSIGAQIYAIRSMRVMLTHLEGIEKEEVLDYMQSFIGHEDPVVSWDTSLVLFRILRDEPSYRSYVLAKMIKTLNETENQSSVDSITRFFKKIAEESYEIGQMAISTLAVRLASGDNPKAENLILGVKALLRGNPQLADDLIDQIAVTLSHPDEELRSNAYLVLSNMAQYGTGKESEILQLVLKGIEDDSERVQKIAYNALTEEVAKAPQLLPEIFEIIDQRFSTLSGVPLVGALNTIKKIITLTRAYDEPILMMIISAVNSEDPEVRKQVLEIYGDISLENPTLSEDMYRIAEANLNNEHEIIRQEAVITLGKVVVGNPQYSRSVYREISKSRDDDSYIVQLAAIESMGYVAASSMQLADEIFTSLLPLLEDKDWQVRLSALNGLYAAAQVQSKLKQDLIGVVKTSMRDSNRNIRLQTLDISAWLIDNYRATGEELLNQIVKDLGKGSEDEFITMLNTLEQIANRHLLLLPKIVKNLNKAYEMENNNLRFSANEVLKAAINKANESRNINNDLKKELNNLVTKLMKAANHSSAKIRRSAYEALTEIPAGLPDLKVSNRCRNALSKASKLEKDVALVEYLEECKIRSKKPLDFDFGDKIKN